MPTRVAALTAVTIAALLVGGLGIVTVDASDRVNAVRTSLIESSKGRPGAEYYETLIDTPGFIRRQVTETLVNDAMPVAALVPRDGYVAIVFGAFGRGDETVTLRRPWTLRLVTVPLAAGLVLAVSATLIAASRWTPSPERPLRSSRRRGRARRARPAAS